MVFIESPIFTADVMELLSDEEYAKLQEHLAHRPDAGDRRQPTGPARALLRAIKRDPKSVLKALAA